MTEAIHIDLEHIQALCEGFHIRITKLAVEAKRDVNKTRAKHNRARISELVTVARLLAKLFYPDDMEMRMRFIDNCGLNSKVLYGKN